MKAKQQPKPAPVEVPPTAETTMIGEPKESLRDQDERRIAALTETLRDGYIYSLKSNLEGFLEYAGLNDLQFLDQMLTMWNSISMKRSEQPLFAFSFMLATDYDRIVEERRAKLEAAA